jgi:predicted dehydrogenase
MSPPQKVRIGVLGAAAIVPMALLRPARTVGEVSITAVAARDESRATAFARKHGIPRVLPGYQELIHDPDIDAVYIPLPNSHHAPWTARAIGAGKHVLCEKPFTSNAAEAEGVQATAATRPELVVMEAFHWRYHPLATRMLEIVRGGELGTIRHIETWMCIPLPLPGNIRYRYDLAGGAGMDVGAYTVHMLRTLAGVEPEVVRAEARLWSPEVDRWLQADFKLGEGATGRTTCSLFSWTLFKMAAHVVGERGEMRVFNPVAPQFFHRLTVRTASGTRRERVPGEPTSTA